MEGATGMNGNRCSNLLRSVDIFPLQLGFTHKNERTYKSPSSGVFSILTLLSVFAYFLYLASNIWNFKVSLKNSLKKRDLVFDNTSFDLSAHNFDFAVNLEYIGSNSSRTDNLFQYISLNVYNLQTYWVETENSTRAEFDFTSIPVERCKEGTFNNDTKYLEKMGIVGKYLCPVTNNFTLQGGYSSDELEFFSVNIRECNQAQLDVFQPGEVCADLAEQQEVAAEIRLSVVFANQYFSGENQDQPIQQDYKMLMQGVPFQQSYYTMAKLSINYAILEDSWLFESFHRQNISYSSIRIDQQYGRTQIPNNIVTPFITVMVMLDENIEINQRTAFNFFMAVQSLGGFSSVVMVVSKIIFTFAQKFNFLSEVISHLYSENSDENEEENVNQDDLCNSARLGQSVQNLNQSARKLRGQSNRADLEEQDCRYSVLIKNLLSQYFQRKPPELGFFQYLSLNCRKASSKSRAFVQSQAKLEIELNMEQVLRKIRMLDLYLQLQLTQGQKTILQVLTTRSQIESHQADLQLQENTITQQGDSKIAFIDSLSQLIESATDQNGCQFDKNLASHLGFEYDPPNQQSRHVSKEKRAKKKLLKDENKALTSVKQPSFSFKKLQKKMKTSIFKEGKTKRAPEIKKEEEIKNSSDS